MNYNLKLILGNLFAQCWQHILTYCMHKLHFIKCSVVLYIYIYYICAVVYFSNQPISFILCLYRLIPVSYHPTTLDVDFKNQRHQKSQVIVYFNQIIIGSYLLLLHIKIFAEIYFSIFLFLCVSLQVFPVSILASTNLTLAMRSI